MDKTKTDETLHDLLDYRAYLIRLALAVLLAVGVYAAVDFWTLLRWDVSESLVVEIVDIGGEKLLPQENPEEPFQAVEVELAARVLTGAQTGRTLPVVVTQMKGSGTELIKGYRYILVTDVFEDGSALHSIADVFRIPSVLGTLVFACACLVTLTGRAGTMALLGLSLSVICLLWGFIPLAVKGFPPLLLASLTVFFISVVTVFCVVRRKGARGVALLGTLGGTAGALFFGGLMVEFWQLSGLAGESASLLVTTIEGLNIQGILLASVIIGSIGAVLDVSVTITASMSELAEYASDISLFRLWGAGIRIGSEVLGSMINTLVLTYIGTSLPVAMLISNAGADFWGLMNDPYIGQEIVQSLAGTSGLLLTIPTTAACFVLQEKLRRRKREAASDG